MGLINNQITSEGNVSMLNFRQQITTRATANTTLTLSITSTGNQQFTGTVAGQIVNLGNATGYNTGHEWCIINDSTVTVTIQNNAGSTLVVLQPSQRAHALLQDNSTSTGVWILYLSSTVAPVAGGLLIATFASTANNVSNTFLSTYNIGTSDAEPAIIPIAGTIARVTYTSSGGGASTGNLEFRVNTSVGAAALTVTLNGATGSFNVSLNVNAADQLNCKVGAGASNVGKPLVNVYM